MYGAYFLIWRCVFLINILLLALPLARLLNISILQFWSHKTQKIQPPKFEIAQNVQITPPAEGLYPVV